MIISTFLTFVFSINFCIILISNFNPSVIIYFTALNSFTLILAILFGETVSFASFIFCLLVTTMGIIYDKIQKSKVEEIINENPNPEEIKNILDDVQNNHGEWYQK